MNTHANKLPYSWFRLFMTMWISSLVILYLVRAVVEQSFLKPFNFLFAATWISAAIFLFVVFVFNFLLVLLPRFNSFVMSSLLLVFIAINVALMLARPVYNTKEQHYYDSIQEKMQQRVEEETKAFEKMRAERREQEAKEFPFPWEKAAR